MDTERRVVIKYIFPQEMVRNDARLTSFESP